MYGKLKLLRRLVVALCVLGVTSLAAAELTVIFDNGQASPLSDFLGPLDLGEPERDSSSIDKSRLGAADVQSLLPILSPGLTPGKITPRQHKVPFARAFFLIGSDAVIDVRQVKTTPPLSCGTLRARRNVIGRCRAHCYF